MADQQSSTRPGTLTLAGLPIGHRDDTTPRLRAALENAEIIAAEDTRRLRQFAARIGVCPGGERGARIVSYYDANERERAAELLADLQAGHDVLLVTDAGMPGVSDPGYRLITACVDAGVPMTVIPGPSAVTAALVLSGLPTDRFCFEGFPPRKGLAAYLAGLADERRTMVFFEAPHRLAATLTAMADAFGPDRPAAVCRELTKTYEEVRRGGQATPEALVAAVAAREDQGVPRKQAIQQVAQEYGVPKREVYNAVHRTPSD